MSIPVPGAHLMCECVIQRLSSWPHERSKHRHKPSLFSILALWQDLHGIPDTDVARSQGYKDTPNTPSHYRHTWQRLEHQLQLRHHVGHLTTSCQVHLCSAQVVQRLRGVQPDSLWDSRQRLRSVLVSLSTYAQFLAARMLLCSGFAVLLLWVS
jgi:hypothetical protein